MSQIFLSHSQQDEEIKNLFSNVFRSSPVRGVYMEYENIGNGQSITSEHIKSEIEKSSAVFVVLSKNVTNISHTRDWITWETGYAAGREKDIWIFEPALDIPDIKVVIPHFKHYVPFAISKNAYYYIKTIVDSYDDSQVLSSAVTMGAVGAGVGASLSSREEQAGGAIFGGVLGAFFGAALADKSNMRPIGSSIKCIECEKMYNVHISPGVPFRCPSCNTVLILPVSTPDGAGDTSGGWEQL